MTTHLDPLARAAQPSPERADRLFAAALAIVSARTLDEMLRVTTVRAAQIIGAHEALTVLRVEPDWTGAIATTWNADDGDPTDGASGETTLVPGFEPNDVQAEVCRANRPRRVDGPGRPLAVPLVGREGTNLGLVQLSQPYRGEFDDADEQLLGSLAQFTASAIEQLRLHADLAYQSGLTRTVAENATSGLLLMDPGGRLTYINSAGSAIIGHDVASMEGRSLHEVVHHTRPDGTPLAMDDCRIWRTVLREERSTSPFDDTFIRPDGSFYPVRIAAAPVRRDGRLVAVVLEVQDITDEQAVARRLSDLAVSASDRAAKLRGLIQSIGDAVVVCEADGRVSLMNPAAVSMFGPRVTHEGQLIERLRTDGDAVEPGVQVGGAYLLTGAERETWVEARVFPVPHAPSAGRGEVRLEPRTDEADPAAGHGRIYVFRDVTGSRRAKVVRETFIGMLSHELRTPITTVYGGAKVLAGRAQLLAPEVRAIVADIEADSERLFRLVEDLVVLTKSEASTLEAGREPILLHRLLPRLVLAEASRWPGLTFDVDCPPTLQPVLAEETYVEQVVRNLLTNAAKYGGSAGRIDVVCSAERDEVAVRVLDRGPGFSDSDADHLFDLYYRSPQATRRAAGAGIGLFVCKSLVEAMGGRIWARAREGGGSEFGFALAAMSDPAEEVAGEG